MAAIISSVVHATYRAVSYILTSAIQNTLAVLEHSETLEAKFLTRNSSANNNVQMLPQDQSDDINESLDDNAYIPWPVSSSHVRVTPSMLPRDNFVVSHNEILYDVPLTFCHRKLPSAKQVRAASSLLPRGKPHVVPFPALGVLVKFGPRPRQGFTTPADAPTSLSEAQSLYAVRHFLGKRVPVPEVYAFIHDGNDSFLYMELIQGMTLLDCWAGLSEEARTDVSAQLKQMMEALREFEQDPSDSFIGTLGRQPPQDVMFGGIWFPEPFTSIATFHDYFSNPRSRPSPHDLRNTLHDDQQLYFTHGDINGMNIIVSPPSHGPVRIRAIIDWHQSGWYPANWEYCKARLQISDRDTTGWLRHLSEFLERCPTCWFWDWEYFSFIVMWTV